MTTGHTLRAFGLAAGLAFAAILPAAAQPAPADPAAPPLLYQGGKFAPKGGEAIYKSICAGCHMPDGRGAEGSGKYPALAGNPRLAAAAYPIHVIVKGQKGMPPLGEFFDDDQVVAVVGYIRTHFGNSYPAPVTAAEVKAQR
jgi:mono/diheme cytochrome c family protein